MDLENRYESMNIHPSPSRADKSTRAYWISTTNQRWLSLRLDFLGSLLLLAVSLLCVGARFTISPAQTGVVVSYMLTIQSVSYCFRRHDHNLINSTGFRLGSTSVCGSREQHERRRANRLLRSGY